MKRLLDQWERKNSKAKGQQTVDDWEREIADDEVMRDASPPPAPPSQPVVSDDSVELPAPLSGQVEALETVGICMLVEYMLAPPGAEEPQQLRAFWPDASAAEPVPAQNTEVLHDFMFRLFATCTTCVEINQYVGTRRKILIPTKACTLLNVACSRSCMYFGF
jgi:hypothetical protein